LVGGNGEKVKEEEENEYPRTNSQHPISKGGRGG